MVMGSGAGSCSGGGSAVSPGLFGTPVSVSTSKGSGALPACWSIGPRLRTFGCVKP